MARLPVPGSDNGTWGTVLNDFLLVEHNPDGTLNAGGSLATKADDSAVVHLTGNESVGGIKTFSSSPLVPTPTAAAQAASKGYVDGVVSSGAPDATTLSKGIVQLAGDLGGTGTAAAAPVITDNAITTNKIAGGAVTTAKIATGAVTTNEIADGTITDTDISGTAAIAKTKLAALNIVDADVSAISESKIANLPTDLAAKAPLASPALTGTPTAPTAVGGTNTTQIATTAFVEGEIGGKADKTTAISAGTGLAGGGDLSANRTLSVTYGTTAGTAAQGNDSRITGALQASTVTTKGDLLAATAASTVTRLGVGSDGNILTADSTQATGIKWAPPAVSVTKGFVVAMSVALG